MADLLECLAGMTEGVMAMDGQQRILLWNRAAERLLGVTAKEVLGRHCYEVIRGRDELGALPCRPACDSMTLAKKAKPIPTRDVLTLTKGGRQLWANVSHVVLSPHRKDGVAFVAIFRDISRQKGMEQIVQQISTTLARLCAQGPSDQVHPGHDAEVTPREQQVLKLLSERSSTLAIAGQLRVSPATVKNHIHNIFRKLGVHSRLAAVTLAGRRRLFS